MRIISETARHGIHPTAYWCSHCNLSVSAGQECRGCNDYQDLYPTFFELVIHQLKDGRWVFDPAMIDRQFKAWKENAEYGAEFWFGAATSLSRVFVKGCGTCENRTQGPMHNQCIYYGKYPYGQAEPGHSASHCTADGCW